MNHLEVPYQKSKTFSVKTSMLSFALKVLFSGLIIAFASWLSVKKPILAGFIIALPLMSLISIFFSYLEHKDMEKTITFSKSILVGVPASLTFFIPFFFAKSLGLSFFTTYLIGIIFLVCGFFTHKFIMNHL
tara:strand:- start:186 stop:581 length:396 start_codon:yes stop_codon:yes gene_type:complete